MKKSALILWIVAGLFFVCSVPLFLQGNAGSGVCGVVIAAALAFMGFRKNARAEEKKEAKAPSAHSTSAAPAQAQKREQPPTAPAPSAQEPATESKYEFLKTKVAGVTFKNGRKNRQTILRAMYFHDAPFNKGDMDLELKRYEYESKPAFGVYVNGEQIGNIPAEHTAFVEENLSRCDGITHIEVYGGGEGRSYGAEITVRFRKE